MIRRAAILVVVLGCTGCWSNGPRPNAATPEVKAIKFLEREVPAWSRENGCFSCHNNGDGARALYAAGRRGFRIPPGALADTTAWVRQPSQWERNKGDPGFSDQRLADIQFAASLLAAIESGAVKDRRALRAVAEKLVANQSADGAWQVEPHNPIGSPATYGTALATFMSWQTLVAAGVPETSDSIRKAQTWLRSVRLVNVPNASVSLLFSARGGAQRGGREQAEAIAYISSAETQGGGWGPYRDSPAEIFDTALALLALAEAPAQPETSRIIQRGRAFLQSQQWPDGSWPATTRPSGGQSYAQQISTTAWATLALLRTSDAVRGSH
jgi:hypothetical protein